MIVGRIKAFASFWYDFVVGDDWRVALGVVLALGLTALVAHQATSSAWWIPPLAVLVLLPMSVRRGARNKK